MESPWQKLWPSQRERCVHQLRLLMKKIGKKPKLCFLPTSLCSDPTISCLSPLPNQKSEGLGGGTPPIGGLVSTAPGVWEMCLGG